MNRRQIIVLLVLVPAVIGGGLLLGTALRDADDDTIGQGVRIGGADEAGEFAHDYLIPLGTAERIAAGKPVEIVPAELEVRVGEAIRIVNDDSEDHVVGVFFVAAGETLTQRFKSEGVLEGECSVHPSGAFTLRVVA